MATFNNQSFRFPRLERYLTGGESTTSPQQYLSEYYEPERETIMGRFAQARGQTDRAYDASRALTESKYNTKTGEELESGERSLKQATEAQRGFAQSPVSLSLMASETEKRIRGLETQKKELLMMNEYERASALSDLILKEQTAITDARTRFLNEYFATEQEKRAGRAEDREMLGFLTAEERAASAEERAMSQEEREKLNFRTPEQLAVLSMAEKYPDAGITAGDNLESLQQKVLGSQAYRLGNEQTRAQIESALASAASSRANALKIASEIQQANSVGDTKKSEALSGLQLVNTIIDSGKLSKITGYSRSLTGKWLDTAEVRGQVKQLLAILTLENRQKLKGQGTITDYEQKILENASNAFASALDPKSGTIALTEEQLERQLNQVRGVFQNAAGLPANVVVQKGNAKEVVKATRQQIEQMIADGYSVEYIGDVETQNQDQNYPQSQMYGRTLNQSNSPQTYLSRRLNSN